MKAKILVLRSSYYQYREYLMRLVSRAADVWLLNDRVPSWEKEYIQDYAIVDTLDIQAVIQAAENFEIRFDGVLCWDEIRIHVAAKLAERLGLPGPSAAAIECCRDKRCTRTALDGQGIAQPRSLLVESEVAGMEAANQIGFPVIVKPRSLAASAGVSVVVAPEHFSAAFKTAYCATERGVAIRDARVLVEEFVDGEEISIDAAWCRGEVYPLFLARKQTGFYPFFEETGHMVNGRDPLLANPQIREILINSHRAVGLTSGITHTELRLTATGPSLIEINGRLGGDFIPLVGSVATGLNPGEIAVDIACGRAPTKNAHDECCAAVKFIYPSHNMVVKHIAMDAGALPGAVVAANVLASVGQSLRLPPADNVSCRLAYAIVRGESFDDCQRSLVAAEKAFHWYGTPID